MMRERLVLALGALALAVVAAACASGGGEERAATERPVAEPLHHHHHHDDDRVAHDDWSELPESEPAPPPTTTEPASTTSRVASSGTGSVRRGEAIDREGFRRLLRVQPATVLDGRDFRAPYAVAQRFLRAVLRGDAEAWQQAVHLESPLVLGPLVFPPPADSIREAASPALPEVAPESFSVWRARLGRYRGIAGWGVTDLDLPEVAVFLEPVADWGEVTVLRLRPDPRPPDPAASPSDWDGAMHEARSWRVYWVERTFEPETVVPQSEWVLRRFDDREAQPRYRGDEALAQPAVTDRQLLRWFASIVTDARAERLDGVQARTLSDDERRATNPPHAHLTRTEAPTLTQEALKRRLARIVQAPLTLETIVVLDQYQLAGSRSVFVRSLAVLGESHQMRQAYRIDWRLAQGLYKIAHIEAVPFSPRLEALAER